MGALPAETRGSIGSPICQHVPWGPGPSLAAAGRVPAAGGGGGPGSSRPHSGVTQLEKAVGASETRIGTEATRAMAQALAAMLRSTTGAGTAGRGRIDLGPPAARAPPPETQIQYTDALDTAASEVWPARPSSGTRARGPTGPGQASESRSASTSSVSTPSAGRRRRTTQPGPLPPSHPTLSLGGESPSPGPSPGLNYSSLEPDETIRVLKLERDWERASRLQLSRFVRDLTAVSDPLLIKVSLCLSLPPNPHISPSVCLSVSLLLRLAPSGLLLTARQPAVVRRSLFSLQACKLSKKVGQLKSGRAACVSLLVMSLLPASFLCMLSGFE